MAGDQDFVIVNDTGVSIFQVMISPTASDNWGEDIMGKDVLIDGDSVEVQFSWDEEAEFWDIKATDEAGDGIVFSGLDLMGISQVTLQLDEEGNPSAIIE